VIRLAAVLTCSGVAAIGIAVAVALHDLAQIPAESYAAFACFLIAGFVLIAAGILLLLHAVENLVELLPPPRLTW